MSPVKGESTNTVPGTNNITMVLFTTIAAKLPPLLISQYNLFLLPFPYNQFLFSGLSSILFYSHCYCYSVAKDLGKSWMYVAHVSLIVPHSWHTFLI